MRLMPLISSVLILVLSGTAFAQEWHEFSSLEDRFSINFPGQPTVTETTWVSQFSAILRRASTAARRVPPLFDNRGRLQPD